MKIVITEDSIEISGFDPDVAPGAGDRFTCRTAAQEAAAWGIKRLARELEKSIQFYRTGEPTDKICID